MGTGVREAALVIIMAMLAACSSGGGGGAVIVPSPPENGPSESGPSRTEVPLASFAAVAPNQTVVMEGTSASLSGTWTTFGGAPAVQSVERGPLDTATVRFGYDSAKALTSISVTTSLTSFSFDRNAPGHSLSCSGAVCSAENPTTSAIAIDPLAVGWNYQSFGVWGMDTGPTSWNLGAVSAGSPTSDNSLPLSGSANFIGIASGFYSDLVGWLYGTTANMNALVDFGSRRIQFSTSNTSLVNTTTNVRTTDNGLNMSGTLVYAPGVNSFSGPVTTQNGLLGGQSAGRFYGPKAEEIGGVYSLRGTGDASMVGAFGGKR